MFIIIPFIIIFLLYAYIALNDVSKTTEIIIYISMGTIILGSFLLARKIKNDMKQQEINSIKIEIYELEQKLKNDSNSNRENIIHKIDTLQKELENIYHP